MAKPGTPRRRPEAPSVAPTTITELARRYHSCAVALSRSLGIPMSETFVLQFHNAISSIFIASDRAGVRLPSGVQLPPLAQGNHVADAPVASPGRSTTAPPVSGNHTVEPVEDGSTVVEPPNGDAVVVTQESPPADPSTNGSVTEIVTTVTSPTTIPTDAGLPCGGVAISLLKPAQLSMLVSKTARLVSDGAAQWVPLLHALERERNTRLDRGRKPRRPDPDLDPVGHVEVPEGEDDVP